MCSCNGQLHLEKINGHLVHSNKTGTNRGLMISEVNEASRGLKELKNATVSVVNSNLNNLYFSNGNPRGTLLSHFSTDYTLN